MAVERISRTFKDISLSFEPHPVTKDLQILKNESAIKRSVRNIIETIPSEKFFNPNFGSRVNELLFDFVDVGSALLIEEEIKTALKELRM
jgi:phage baseplate assembly protein W